MTLVKSKLRVSLALLLSAGAGQALADWNGNPGLNCFPAAKSANVYYSVTGGNLGNSGKTSITVICPVSRDIAEGGVDRVKLARVRLRDRNARTNGYCTFRSRTASGDLHDSKTKRWTGVGFKTVDMPRVDAANWGSYSLVCRIPGRDARTNLMSYIRSYAVDEND